MYVPDMLEVPGMIKATRWVSADPREGQHRKYLALYELETDDVKEFDLKVKESRFSNLDDESKAVIITSELVNLAKKGTRSPDKSFTCSRKSTAIEFSTTANDFNTSAPLSVNSSGIKKSPFDYR